MNDLRNREFEGVMLDVIIALVMVLNAVVTFVGGNYLSLLIGKNVEKVKRATGVDFGIYIIICSSQIR